MAEAPDNDRGKLIMACGTGKTFTALRIAEAVAGIGGRVLYLVPSISLFQQSMREWATQRSIPHRYIGVCSDTRAGRNDERPIESSIRADLVIDPPQADFELDVLFAPYELANIVVPPSASLAADAGVKP